MAFAPQSRLGVLGCPEMLERRNGLRAIAVDLDLANERQHVAQEGALPDVVGYDGRQVEKLGNDGHFYGA